MLGKDDSQFVSQFKHGFLKQQSNETKYAKKIRVLNVYYDIPPPFSASDAAILTESIN